MLPKEILDFLLAQRNHAVEYVDGEWVWVETFRNGNSMVIHGEGPAGYTQAQAYEDALRNLLGIDPIADEKKL